jgi:cytochrome b subunit of formate dehydrogenase
MKAQSALPEEVYIRFSVLHRLLHWLVMLGFTGLALTGFSLKFNTQGWARLVLFLSGGPDWLGYWHRFWAVLTYGGVLIHLAWLVYFKTLLQGRLTGPQSLFPGKKDFRDLRQHLLYFLGQQAPPAFNHFTYWEKVDYWAILLGMNTMGLTGLVLWFPEFFATLMPGYFINLAQILHLYEAIMAVALKFVVHIMVVHLRPETFPLDKTIFSGKTTAARIRQDHPGEWPEKAGSLAKSPLIPDSEEGPTGHE